MWFDASVSSAAIFLQVVVIDLLLSGDNAVVIAMACQSLPAKWVKKAILYGTAAAIVLRLVFAVAVAWLMTVPLLKLIGSVALLVIAVRLTISEKKEEPAPARSESGFRENPLPADAAGSSEDSKSAGDSKKTLWSAIVTVVVADAVMSLDNVLALVAASRGSLFFLVAGLALSIPLLMFGALFVTRLLKRYPWLIPAGGALLGWIAGDIAVADDAISGWVAAHAPALTWVLPVFGAVFVLLVSWIIRRAGCKRKAK